MTATVFACGISVNATDDAAIERRDVTAHIYSMDTTETISCLFESTMPDMAYISTVDFLKNIYVDTPTEEENPDGTFTVTNPKGTMLVDPENDTLHFDGFESFLSAKPNTTGTELDSPYCKDMGTSIEGKTNGVDLDLSEYGIDILACDGKSYLPVSTISLLFGETYNSAIYNDDNVYFVHCSDFLTTGPYYKNAELYTTFERSQDLIELTYNELCFAVDKIYGRPASAEIASTLEGKSFDQTLDDYSVETRRAKELLMSENKVDYLYGLAYLTKIFYDGGHTSLSAPALVAMTIPDSAVYKEIERRTNENPDSPDKDAMTSVLSSAISSDSGKISALRDSEYEKYETVKVWDDASKSRLVVNEDTVVFVFDSFINEAVYNLKWSLDYAKEKGAKRFVFDISCNTGGNSAVVMYIMALLSNSNKDNHSSAMRTMQTLTGNISRSDYDVDLNLDGEINDLDNDFYYDFEYAIVCSHISYSCGNLLPCLAKDVGIPILGERSHGGACSVFINYTPENFYYTISSYNKFINKDNKDVDGGAEPDYDLTAQKTDDDGVTTVDYAGFYDIGNYSTMIDEFYGVTDESSEEPSDETSDETSDEDSDENSKVNSDEKSEEASDKNTEENSVKAEDETDSQFSDDDNNTFATGDSTTVLPVIIIMLISSAGIVLFYRKKKREM